MNSPIDYKRYLNDEGFLKYLEGMMPESKMQKIAQVLPYRTRHVVTVIENVLDSNNTNAILRTSEALGIQEAHLVYGNIKYIPQKSVSKGAHLWMDTFKYGEEHCNNALECIRGLKNRGYQLAVTSPDGKCATEDLDICKPIAVCFGQESKGISEVFINCADITIRLPQHGFTNSYNVAVAAGMVLMPIMKELRKSNIAWQLSHDEQKAIYHRWILNYTEHLSSHYQHFKNVK
jgi:tRNA (guanosine-2'-O-)-methyltransferase